MSLNDAPQLTKMPQLSENEIAHQINRSIIAGKQHVAPIDRRRRADRPVGQHAPALYRVQHVERVQPVIQSAQKHARAVARRAGAARKARRHLREPLAGELVHLRHGAGGRENDALARLSDKSNSARL